GAAGGGGARGAAGGRPRGAAWGWSSTTAPCPRAPSEANSPDLTPRLRQRVVPHKRVVGRTDERRIGTGTACNGGDGVLGARGTALPWAGRARAAGAPGVAAPARRDRHPRVPAVAVGARRPPPP